MRVQFLARVVVAGLLCYGTSGCAASRSPQATPARPVAQSPVPEIVFLDDFNIAPGADFGDWPEGTVGGISAIAYEESSGKWLALSDAKSACRIFELDISQDASGLNVVPAGIVYLTEPEGTPFSNGLDPEGIVLSRDGTLVVSVEGNTFQEPIDEPRVLEFDREGHLTKSYDVPNKFFVESLPPRKGVRANKAFESLTITPDGKTIFTATESSLIQDGNPATFAAGAAVRIVEYVRSGNTRRPGREFIYQLEKLKPVLGFRNVGGNHGLVELVALSSTQLLAMERGFVHELTGRRRVRSQIRLFLVDLAKATDVSGIESLSEVTGVDAAGFEEIVLVTKQLILDLDDIVSRLSLPYRRLDNFEAMGLGPKLPGGGRSLIIASDDNFSRAQRTAFLMFRINIPSEG